MTFVDFIKSIPSSSEVPLFIDNRNTDLTRWSYTDLANQARQMALSKNIYFVNVLDFFCPQKNADYGLIIGMVIRLYLISST